MTELFRFIQQAFVVPGDEATIDVTSQSAFQVDLRDLILGPPPAEYDRVRAFALNFLDPRPQSNGFAVGGLGRMRKYLALREKLLAIGDPVTALKVNEAVKSVFGVVDARTLAASEEYEDERNASSDIPLAVKITTRFDLADGPSVTSMRQVIGFIDDFVAGRAEPLSARRIRSLLDRPLHVPQLYMPPKVTSPGERTEPTGGSPSPRELLVAEGQIYRQAYDTLMATRPSRFTVSASAAPEARQTPAPGRAEAAPSAIGLAPEVLADLDPVVQERLREQLGDPGAASLTDIVDVVKRRWLEVARETESREPARLRTFRLGMNIFAVQDNPAAEDEQPVPDFSHAITRPVGIGDLQVVRQELIGYVPAEISHIENVLPGELMSRTTTREETTELTITDETETTQTDERDTQSTERNELSSEAQKEAGEQSSATSDQTSTSSYGRLVENSKTNYARSVTDRAVNKLTRTVRQQRVQREKKVYTEKALHQFDNSNGLRQIRGIYQWVDKKYKTKVFNYGKRLLYDVVLPEPASFLIESLKSAAQPENYQLTRPLEPPLLPTDLDAGNYAFWAAKYGVSGAVTPPPEEFKTVVAHTDLGKVTEKKDAYGEERYYQYFGHFTLQVPADYAAVGGYVQRVNIQVAKDHEPTENRELEFFVGEETFLRFTYTPEPGGIEFLNKSFVLKEQTGDIPVTVRTFPYAMQAAFAVGLVCRRTDHAYAQWQLKTHAQIVAGYERLRTEFLDQLTRYQQAVRVQLASAHNFAHDSTMERQELKKAFIHLLMSEHFGQVYYPTPVPGQFPPDPRYIKQWGAVVAFFERAFEWEHLMFVYYPYFWGRKAKWGELVSIQDLDPNFEAFLKAGAARVVIPVRPGFEAALAHFHETGDVWMGEEIPDMFSDNYVTIIAEIKARNAEPDEEVCVAEWEVRLPTTLVMLKEEAELPEFRVTPCLPAGADHE
ncbi:hypothetical protein [Nocardia sp. NPDC051832]|uniref:hypothetical protein n=1 Tax=Nocardia sp. NPDC051832 TaxID=3155673 RepID=UPI003438622D